MKNLRLCVVLVCIAVLLASCGFNQIEDMNGDDTALCSLTETDILAEYTSSTSFGSLSTQINDNYSYSVKKLSGVYSLIEFDAKGQCLSIDFSTRLKQGNLRIVVLYDGEYAADIPIAENQSITINDPDGHYEIRLAAESAQLEVDYSYEVGQ